MSKSEALMGRCAEIATILDELPQDVWEGHYELLEDIREFVTRIDEQLSDARDITGDECQRLKQYHKQVRKFARDADIDL